MRQPYYITEIRRALKDIFLSDNKAILLGEDIRDPFGGCFKVTQGLSSQFNDRVINTPISEAAITGITTGLAIGGYKPILEIMFYDFMTLTTDQILNHMIKFKKLWGLDLNITIRTVIGSESYGVTHCQNLDRLYNNDIIIIHPTLKDDIYSLYMRAFAINVPKILVEDSKFYKEKLELVIL